MKKLFKLLSLLSLVQELRGHRHHSHHGYGHSYRRSRDYYPLHHRGHRRRHHGGGLRHSLISHVLGRLLHGRRY